MVVEGDLIARCEMFDEADIDAALARFDELHPHPTGWRTRRRAYTSATMSFRGSRLGPAKLKCWPKTTSVTIVDVSPTKEYDVAGTPNSRACRSSRIWESQVSRRLIAIRGDRLALCRTRGTTRFRRDSRGRLLRIVEINADDQVAARIAFDLEDIDAAYEELDSRYLTGEAAAHAHTWSVISRALTALHRHELPALTPDCVNIDHRRGIAFAPGDMTAYIGATLDDVPDFSIHFEMVHRLNNFGAVVTFTSSGTSRAGFDAEWRMIQVLAVRGDMISRCEAFDEEDLDVALEKFDELNRPRLENAASRVYEHLQMCFLAATGTLCPTCWPTISSKTTDVGW